MNESSLKKIAGVLLGISMVALIWAIGSNSRKKVELEKNISLYQKLNQLTQTNSILIGDIKKIKNELATSKENERKLQEELAKEQLKSSLAQTKLKTLQADFDNTNEQLNNLRDTNLSLLKKLSTSNEKIMGLQNELAQLNEKCNQLQTNTITTSPAPEQKKTKGQSTDKKDKQLPINKNFGW